MAKLEHLHVVSFDNPFPPNYGGAIDVFYKLRALKRAGVKVILHAFEYGRKPSHELNRICDRVYYYQRRNFVNPFIGSLPYIVNTRDSGDLLQNLLKDRFPILFEGLHTCFFLDHPMLKSRLKIVRTHNIEHDYYGRLEEVEANFFKKYFFSKEAYRLKEFEQILSHADMVMAISLPDQAYFSSKYKNVTHVTAFHPNEQVTSKTGKGDYALYHGKLSVGENDEAARFLAGSVFNDLPYPLIIAGDKPSKYLLKSIEGKAAVRIYDHLTTEEISAHIAEAQMNVMPTFQNTGIKLKLLNVLYQGRHVIVNKFMVEGTGLEPLCHIAADAADFRRKIIALKELPFEEQEISKRRELLGDCFNNEMNVKRMIRLITEKL